MSETEVAKAEAALYGEKGLPGLHAWGGVVNDEFLNAWRGKQGQRTVQEMMDNDPIVGAILFSVDMLVRAVDWRAVPAEDTDQAKEWSNFLETCVHDMSDGWDSTLSAILSFLPFGWSFHEIVYKERLGHNDDPEKDSKYDDGRVGWRKFAHRGQNTLFQWEFDAHGGVTAFVQSSPPTYKPIRIPMEKGLLFRTNITKNNPEGRSILRNSYRPWYFKKRIENLEGIGIERDLAGIPIAWVPPEWLDASATPEQKSTVEEIKRIVTSIKNDEQTGVVFPLQYDMNGHKLIDLSLLTTGGKRQFNTDAIIGRYDQRIALTVLADFILLGHEKVGSFNLGVTKVDLFSAALGAWLDVIKEVLNMHAIPKLMRLNGCPPDLVPILDHADVQRIDLDVLGTFIEKVAKAGGSFFPDDGLEDHLRLLAGMPELTEEAKQQRDEAVEIASQGPPGVPQDEYVPSQFLQGANGAVQQ